MTAPTVNDIYHVAQDLIRIGQPVFPCKSFGEKAKAPVGSLVPNGVNDATLNRDTVKRWLKAMPSASLGLATGIIWDVLDVDIKPETGVDGRVHLPRLKHLGLLDGCVKVIRTPSGGWHLYFPASHGLTNKAHGATLGLDVRATGGYVLAPPSYIETPEYSGSYEDHGPTKGSTGEPLYWDLIVSALAPIDVSSNKPIELLPSERRASVAALREWMKNRQAGERNNALHWCVCRCIEANIDPHEMLEPALLAGLTEDETLKTIDSALRRAGLKAEDMDTEGEAMFPATA